MNSAEKQRLTPGNFPGKAVRLMRQRHWFLLSILFFLAVCALRMPSVQRKTGIQITAHRGCSAHYPENTMSAFRAAAAGGADCIELDLQQTADGIPVVSHDESLHRTTGVHHRVASLCCRDLRRLDAGSWYATSFAGERIPTFEEVLRLAQRQKIHLNVEIKDCGCRASLCTSALALIRRYHMETLCAVASQNYGVLCRIKRCAPELPTIYITGNPVPASLQPCADEISAPYSSLTSAAVAQIHRRGKRVHVWTVDTPEEIRGAAALNADDVITDDPGLAQSIICKPQPAAYAFTAQRIFVECARGLR